MNELLAKDETYLKKGVPLEDLKKTLNGYDTQRFSEDSIEVFLEREFNCANLKLLELAEDHRVFPKDIDIPNDLMQAQNVKEDKKATPTKGTKKRKSEKKVDFKKESANARKCSESSEPTSPSNICDNDEDESETATKIIRVSPTPKLQLINAADMSPGHSSPNKECSTRKNSYIDGTTPPVLTLAKKSKPNIAVKRGLPIQGHQSVAEKVADAVRKTYEGKIELGTLSKLSNSVKLTAHSQSSNNGNGANVDSPKGSNDQLNSMSDASEDDEEQQDTPKREESGLLRSKRDKVRTVS